MKNEKKSGLQPLRRILLVLGPLVFLVVGGYFYLTGGRYMSTDDAYMQAARTDISANIAGRVTEIDVHDNQPVKKGDVLFRLDDRDYAIAVEDAKAKLADARLRIAALKATYLQRAADVKAATDTLTYTQTDVDRQKKLAAQGISSQSQLDKAQHALDQAKQQLASAEQGRENVRISLGDDPDADIDAHPSVRQAQAALDKVQLELSYTIVTAPADGIAARVEQLQVGNYIKAATPVFAIVSATDVWVEANFKETELTHMQAGQEASIRIDTYPGRVFKGKVESLGAGTGSSFSLLPPENATGNWVKVVQRLPVRISLDNADAGVAMHAGLSALVDVDTGKTRMERGGVL